jgi:hypothetical protein
MRSGSTLLKALIATRPDCSHLPETSFLDYSSVICNERIIVLKKPAGYDDFDYPHLAQMGVKKIVLIRNPYDTVYSLLQMFVSREKTNSNCNNVLYLISYWYMVYNNIVEKKILESDNTLLVRYEDIIDQPIAETARIFKFIRTEYPEGTDTYIPPVDYEWGWGKDDGGNVIKTLRVQKSVKKRTDKGLLEFINTNSEIQQLLQFYGYKDTIFE